MAIINKVKKEFNYLAHSEVLFNLNRWSIIYATLALAGFICVALIGALLFYGSLPAFMVYGAILLTVVLAAYFGYLILTLGPQVKDIVEKGIKETTRKLTRKNIKSLNDAAVKDTRKYISELKRYTEASYRRLRKLRNLRDSSSEISERADLTDINILINMLESYRYDLEGLMLSPDNICAALSKKKINIVEYTSHFGESFPAVKFNKYKDMLESAFVKAEKDSAEAA